MAATACTAAVARRCSRWKALVSAKSHSTQWSATSSLSASSTVVQDCSRATGRIPSIHAQGRRRRSTSNDSAMRSPTDRLLAYFRLGGSRGWEGGVCGEQLAFLPCLSRAMWSMSSSVGSGRVGPSLSRRRLAPPWSPLPDASDRCPTAYSSDCEPFGAAVDRRACMSGDCGATALFRDRGREGERCFGPHPRRT